MAFHLWATLRALMTPLPDKGAKNLDLVPVSTAPSGGAVAGAVVDSSNAMGAVVASATDVAVAAPGLNAGPVASAVFAGAADSAAALDAQVDSGVSVSDVVPPGMRIVITTDPALDLARPSLLPGSTDDGDGLENLQALSSGGVELFSTVFKVLMAQALDLGHDFGVVYDKVKANAKTLVADLSAK